jgi:hypothetical protein
LGEFKIYIMSYFTNSMVIELRRQVDSLPIPIINALRKLSKGAEKIAHLVVLVRNLLPTEVSDTSLRS